MKEKPIECKGCPLEHDGLGYCATVGPPNAQMILIGEGPGENEATFGAPFFAQAQAGRTLNDWLDRAGIRRRELLISNVIRCFTVTRKTDGTPVTNNGRYKKRTPKPKEVLECTKRHLIPEMKQWFSPLNNLAPRRVVIPIGLPAQLVLMGASGMDLAGSMNPFSLEEFLLRMSILLGEEEIKAKEAKKVLLLPARASQLSPG